MGCNASKEGTAQQPQASAAVQANDAPSSPDKVQSQPASTPKVDTPKEEPKPEPEPQPAPKSEPEPKPEAESEAVEGNNAEEEEEASPPIEVENEQTSNSVDEQQASSVEPSEIEGTLEYQVLQYCKELLSRASTLEVEMTQKLQALCDEFSTEEEPVTLIGLEHKFKGEKSLYRKALGDVDEEQRKIMAATKGGDPPTVSARDVVLSIGDSLRYTVQTGTQNYTEAVKGFLAKLQESGMELDKCKNYWEEGDQYQGINTNWTIVAPEYRFRFELQFHTVSSIEAKHEGHVWYEKFRVERNPDIKHEYYMKAAEAASKAEIPPEVQTIPTLIALPPPDAYTVVGENILNNIIYNEPSITKDVETLVNEVSGEVKDKMFQSVKHIAGLVEQFNIKNPKESLLSAEDEIFDGLQYVVILNDDNYASAVSKIAEDLVNKDYKIDHMSNYWEGGDAYQGLHICAVAPYDQCPFEVQLHTQASYTAKMDTGKALLSKYVQAAESDRDAIFKEILNVWSQVATPEGALEIKGSEMRTVNAEDMEEEAEEIGATE